MLPTADSSDIAASEIRVVDGDIVEIGVDSVVVGRSAGKLASLHASRSLV